MHLDRWAEHTKEPTQDCGALMASWKDSLQPLSDQNLDFPEGTDGPVTLSNY